MHICFLTHEYPKAGHAHGGVGTLIKSLAQMLVSKGNRVSIVGMNYIEGNEYNVEDGVHIYRLNKKKIKGIIWLLTNRSINNKLKEIHKSFPIDIVEATELGLAFIKKQKDIKYVIRLNGGHHFFSESEERGIDRWKGFQEKRSFKKADKIVAVSEYVMNHTARYINFTKKSDAIIFNPANLAGLYDARPEKIVEGRIFFAGTLAEKKGIRQLITAMPFIKKEIPSAHLVIAGRDSKMKDGTSFLKYLRQHISVEIIESISFLGVVSNDKIPALIEQAEVCVYPSHMEAMPLAWIEALGMGRAFIGSKTGPGPELVKDGVNGLLCNPKDPDDIGAKVIQLLSNKELAFKLGKNARIDVLDRFAVEKILQKNIEFYQQVLNS